MREKSVGQVFIQFLWLGCISFGGPAAHIGYFQRTFVQRLGWLTQAEFARLLALCQLLPGPASSQLGFAIGRHRAGLGGALSAFVGFTLPSFVLLLAAAIGIGQLGSNLWLDAALHGLKLLALIVVADAVLTMSRQFCATGMTQGSMVVTAAALWWQPGLLTQLLMLAGGCADLRPQPARGGQCASLRRVAFCRQQSASLADSAAVWHPFYRSAAAR